MRRDGGHIAVVWRDGRRVTVWHDSRCDAVVRRDSGHVTVVWRDGRRGRAARQRTRRGRVA
jgi:hypothetical protein